MPYKTFAQLTARANTAPPRRVVVAAAQDEHCLEAVFRARRDRLVAPVLTGDTAKIRDIAAQMDESLDSVPLHEAPVPQDAAALAVRLIRDGAGEFLMKGKLETAQLLRAVVNRETGLRASEDGVMSHIILLEIPAYHKLLAITDGGMLLSPDLTQKKALLQNAVGFLRALGIETPKVAVLAAAETLNPKMRDSVEAAELKAMWLRGEITGCAVEGPISLDLALVKEKAAIKGYESPVAGDADLLLCPDLTCGNAVAKAIVELAGATLAGLVLGARVPIILPSRASSSDEKYWSVCLAACAE